MLALFAFFFRVSWATARGQGNFYPDNFKPDIPANNIRKPKGTLKNGPPESAQIHFSFISKQTQRVVTEAIIREVFSHFGEVKDVTIKKTTTLPRTGQQTGYGFLDYPLTDEGIQSALQASRIVKQVHIYDILYDCCLTWDLEEIIARRKKQQQQMHDVSQGSPNSSFYSNQLHSESADTHSILHSAVSSNSLLSDSSSLHGRSISDSSNNSMQPSFTTINTSNYDSPYIPDRQYRSTSFPPNHHHQQYPQQSKQQYPESRGMYFQNSHSMEPPSYHQSIPFSTYSASTLSSAVSNHPYQGSSSHQQPY